MYVQNIYCFLHRNAEYVAYENLYNKTPHQILPSTQFPSGRAKYQELWSSGSAGGDNSPCRVDG